jgi:dethiobiotin synthetase
MPTYFVTGSGTDVGKTFVTSALVREFRRRGHAANALKPVASGFDPAAPDGSDPACLLAAMGLPVNAETIAAVTPWQFRAPLSPDMAAAREGRSLDLGDIVAFCRRQMSATSDPLFIEGVGGVLVPLNHSETVLDWMQALALPTLLVTGSYLGTLSHTLTALSVLDSRELDTTAIIISETAGSTVPLEEAAETLRRFTGNRPVFAIPRMAAGEDPIAIRDVADRLLSAVR